MAAQGVPGTALPDDVAFLQARAISLRRASRLDAAWAVYEELAKRAEDDPKLARWVQAEAEVFGWRCRQWDFLAKWYGDQYADRPTAELAWDRFRVLERGGRFEEAIAQAKVGLARHGSSKEWRRKEEALARTYMLGGDYAGARDLLDQTAARGGWTGRRAQFYAGFASLMAGDLDDATTRFTHFVDKGRSYHVESLYWRGRAHQAAERQEDADADFAAATQVDPNGWYALLAQQQQPDQPSIRPFMRDGTWPGEGVPAVPDLPEARTSGPIPLASPVQISGVSGAAAFGRVTWPMLSNLLHTPPTPAPVVIRQDDRLPPASYAASVWYDPNEARRDFYAFAEANKDAWPSLPAVWDLARIGLYDLSGPLMSEMYEDWRAARNRSSHPRYAAARKLRPTPPEWRDLFLYARDHHHAARFTYELWDGVEDQTVARQAWRLAYPLAHDQLVWRESRNANVDPFLVLGLMRQESTYNAIARSRVGASGAMQIMPRTGHLLANLRDDTDFTAQELKDPTLSVTYGIGYLGKLLDRYEGAYPLAIASYNGGPFNVSGWLDGTGADMPMDAWVEHIPFRETRDYVKKVSAGYAAYLDLYAPDGTEVVLPNSPRGNHPDIVDF